jgi:hypothetical protein
MLVALFVGFVPIKLGSAGELTALPVNLFDRSSARMDIIPWVDVPSVSHCLT